MSPRYASSPCLEVSLLDFNGHPTCATHQVVMVISAASSVENFAIILNDRISFTGICKSLKGAVDGRESDGRSAGDEVLMKLLR